MRRGLRVAACFESAACWAALSFTLVRAQSITAHRRSKSLDGTGEKKEKSKGEQSRDSNKPSPISVCDNMKSWAGGGQVNGGCLRWKIWLIFLSFYKPLEVLEISPRDWEEEEDYK